MSDLECRWPPCGFGDPTSYQLIKQIVTRMSRTCGGVRHGPEAFNLFFPQPLDESFLVMWEGGATPATPCRGAR